MGATLTYDMETDVVVIGYGGAGAVSAITAHDNGASVIILEKMPAGGGNTSVCGGQILVPRGMEFVEYLKILSYNTTDDEIIELFVKEALKHKDWFKEMGGELQSPEALAVEFTYPKFLRGPSFPHVHGAQYMDKYNVKGEVGTWPYKRLWNLLSRNVERRQIRVVTNTPAGELVKNDKGEVVGSIPTRPTRFFRLAKKSEQSIIEIRK